MSDKNFSDLYPITDNVSGNDYLVGTRLMPNNTYQDYRYPVSKIGTGGVIDINQETMVITLTNVNSNSYQNVFFENVISEIVANHQSYILDVDFTQTQDIITGINIDFYDGLVCIFKADYSQNKTITVGSVDLNEDDNTLTDSFFTNVIKEIVGDHQSYIKDVDFTQSGNQITGLQNGIQFYQNQVIIAKK